MNEELVNACEELKGYVYFVSRARFYESQGCDTLTSIKKAIEDSKNEGLLRDFWEKMTMEDIIMLETEWDLNPAMEVWREEGREAGREEGLMEGEKKGRMEERMEIINLINKGYSTEDILREFSAQ